MPLRGETIGTAYVRVIADGSEIPGDLEDQLRENEDNFKAAGRRDSKAYAKAFESGLEDQPNLIDLRKSLNRGIAEADISHDFFQSEQWKSFEKDLDTRFGEAGRRAAIEFGQSFGGKGSLKGLEDAVENIHPVITRLRKEVVVEAQRINDDFEKDTKRLFNDVAEVQRRVSRENVANLRKVDASLGGLRRNFNATFAEMDKSAHKFNITLKKLADESEKNLKRTGNVFRRTAHDFDRLSVPIGRLLGKGSRNNFLNFFGSVITNSLRFGNVLFSVLDKVVSGFSKAAGAIGSFVGDIRKQMAQGATAAEAFFTTVATGAGEGLFSTIATGGANIAIGIGAAAIAFGLAALSAGALVSALILLGGIIISLAGTIEFALIAALASIGPLLIPLLGIIGGIVAAVGEFKDATGPLATSIDKVKESAKDLFEQFKDRAFKNAPKLTKAVAKEMKDLDRFVNQAGKGFNRFSTAIVDSLTGPEFDAFENRFAKFLPHAMESLGVIIGNTFEGLGGFLEASIPLANRLLGWLEKITENFSKFTNSKKGQEEIKDFLEKAGDSAKSLGNFLEEAGGLIQDLLSAGRAHGDSIFDSMANALRRVRDYLKENPDAVKQFFGDVETFARQVGHAIERITEAIQTIDSPETRRVAGLLVSIFAGVFIVGAQTIRVFQMVANAVLASMQFIVKAFAEVIKGALNGLSILASGIGVFAAGIPGPVGDGLSAAADSFIAFNKTAIAKVDGVTTSIDALAKEAAKTPRMDIDISAAVNKLTFLQQLLNRINAAIGASNAGVSASPNAIDHGNSQGGIPDDRRQPIQERTGNRVNINVVTPTVDPRAVATETMNRLVALGYV